MSTEPSLWAQVAARYDSPVELRAGVLGARFTAEFDAGLLLVRKPNGVERRVDFDEFRATWRLLAADGSDEMLRIASANVEYLRAIRDDLVGSGVPADTEAVAISNDDVSTMERQLLIEAERFSRPAGEAAQGEADSTSDTEPVVVPPEVTSAPSDQDLSGQLEALREQLAREQTEKDSALREAARLAAALSTADDNLKKEQERAVALERAAAKRAKPAPVASGIAAMSSIGSTPDITAGMVALAESTVREISSEPPEIRKAAETAVDLARRDPASAITKCRVILEVLVKDEWMSVFRAKDPPGWKSFNDLARELDGQPGVDLEMLNTKRTLHRLANPGAHTIDGVSPRRAALVLLMTVSILAGRL